MLKLFFFFKKKRLEEEILKEETVKSQLSSVFSKKQNGKIKNWEKVQIMFPFQNK